MDAFLLSESNEGLVNTRAGWIVACAVGCLIASLAATFGRAEVSIEKTSKIYIAYSRPTGDRTSDALLVDAQGKYVLTLAAKSGDRKFQGTLSPEDKHIFDEAATGLFAQVSSDRTGRPGEPSVNLTELKADVSSASAESLRNWS